MNQNILIYVIAQTRFNSLATQRIKKLEEIQGGILDNQIKIARLLREQNKKIRELEKNQAARKNIDLARAQYRLGNTK